MTQPEVVVLGDLATDVVAHVSTSIATGSDTQATVQLTGGGSGANVAAWLAKSGVDVAFIGRVGSDDAGRLRAAELEALGVSTHLAVDPQHPTGTVVVIVTPDGQRTMLPDRGANLALDVADIPTGLFAAGRHLHISGYVLFHPASRAAALHALGLARAAAMTTSVDPSSAAPLHDIGAQQFLEWTARATLVVPNADEAHVLTGAGASDDAARQLAASYDEVVVTLGAAGALWSDGEQVMRCAAAEVAVVDTTGAGDAFTAGYLRAWRAGEPPAARLAAGTQLAGEAVTRTGARPRG